ncbi:hypothetical protein GQ472_05120 [archaeon]|nr:hypothetical protein [archaeon]
MTYVYGTVYDSEGEGIWHAKVTVHCIETGDTRFDPNTDKDGNYEIQTIECSVGDTVFVNVTKDDVEIGTGTGIVEECTDELPRCNSHIHAGIVNVNIESTGGDIPIPEFPVAALPALLSIFSFGLIRKNLF